MTDKNGSYEVLNPWADADPIPLKGLTAPRVTDRVGKKIGLFVNDKRAALPIRTVLERKLKERFRQLRPVGTTPKGRFYRGKLSRSMKRG